MREENVLVCSGFGLHFSPAAHRFMPILMKERMKDAKINETLHLHVFKGLYPEAALIQSRADKDK